VALARFCGAMSVGSHCEAFAVLRLAAPDWAPPEHASTRAATAGPPPIRPAPVVAAGPGRDGSRHRRPWRVDADDECPVCFHLARPGGRRLACPRRGGPSGRRALPDSGGPCEAVVSRPDAGAGLPGPVDQHRDPDHRRCPHRRAQGGADLARHAAADGRRRARLGRPAGRHDCAERQCAEASRPRGAPGGDGDRRPARPPAARPGRRCG
jgi:hypothetical protein